MLDGTDKNLIRNVENNNPGVLLSGGGGLNKARLKKGARKPPRPSANSRLHDLNNHRPAVQSGPDPQSLHCLPLRPGTKKELLKSKGGKLERGAAQTGVQLNRNLTRPDPHNHSSARLHKPRPASALSSSTKTSPHKPLHKRPLHLSSQNLLEPPQDDPEKVYAGAKFSEPPSPSVLPKPPSHWVGEDRPLTADRSREDRPLTADPSREDRPLTADRSREDRPLTADRSREERTLTADRSREDRPLTADRSREDRPLTADRSREDRPLTADPSRGDRPLTADRSREDRPLTADWSREDRPLTADRSREDRPLTADRSREDRPLTPDPSREDRPLTADRSREERTLTPDRSREDRPLTADHSREDRPLTADRSREERPLTADRSREQMSVHLKVLLKVQGGC